MAGERVAQAASKESLTWCNGAGPANSGPLQLCMQRIKADDPSPRYAESDSVCTPYLKQDIGYRMSNELQALLASRQWVRQWEYSMSEDRAWENAGYIFQLFARKRPENS
jgi:hypothetical protein